MVTKFIGLGIGESRWGGFLGRLRGRRGEVRRAVVLEGLGEALGKRWIGGFSDGPRGVSVVPGERKGGGRRIPAKP